MPYIYFFFWVIFFTTGINNFYHKIRLKKYWIYFGEEDIFDFLFSEIEYFNLSNINIFRYQVNNKKGINLDDKKIKGFIVNN